MSSWGRCQDSLWFLYEMPNGYGPSDDGVVKELGISFEQWSKLIEPIIDAVYPIAFEQGRRQERHERANADSTAPAGVEGTQP